VQELEALACDLTGKEGALLLPSGTMANLAAIIAHDCRNGEVIVEASSHIYNAEGGGLSTLAGALARPLNGEGGMMTAAQIVGAIRDGRDAAAPTRLVCIENTHNAAGGRVIGLAHLASIAATAKRAGLPLHLDGARLFNAAAYLDVNIAALCAYADSVWFALCKGLGAPIGAILLGGREFMSRARRAAKTLGGGMRQAGLIAAPAIIALRDPYERHRRDHALARELARGIAGLDPTLVEVARVQTNIVNCDVTPYADDAADIRKRLAARGSWSTTGVRSCAS
jgi:threonine aldolase